MSHLNEERVLAVTHWTPDLFSFTTTRNSSFRFRSGQFTMIGLEIDGRPLLRAYSLASAHYEDTLSFFSIKVSSGPLTSRLQHLKEGDPIVVGRKATGTLVLDSLLPGRNLYLLGTGTGLAPFASLAKDPETYERFERVVLVHGCRQIDELAYGDRLVATLRDDPYIGDVAREQLVYVPTVTREPFRNRGRITDLIVSGKLFEMGGLDPLDPARDRVMICGGPDMLAETRALLAGRAFAEGSASHPAGYVYEKAFVDR